MSRSNASAEMSLPKPWALGGERRTKKRRDRATRTIKRHELAFILRNLATLLENGVSLPKALSAVARERSLGKHAHLLDAIRRKVETGETFSGALSSFPRAFNELFVNQVKVGERSGTLAETLAQMTEQQEKMNSLRSHVVKKLAYPVVLMSMGGLVISFMLIFVVPVFEETYADAKVPLPLITQFLIGIGRFASSYYWVGLLLVVAGFLAIKQIRKDPAKACVMDRWLLRLPVIGPWLRDLAVLQLMDVLGNLMEAGFLIAEALKVCAGSVGNRAVRRSVQDLEAVVHRGERFSRELERHGDMFPPVVSQLVIIGEQTGKLAKATSHIRDHLRREIERNTNLLVGTIEPVLTISLAASIGVILLAIYLPMFDMIGAVAK